MTSELGIRLLPEIYRSCGEFDRWQLVLDQMCDGLGTKNAAAQLFRRNGSQLQQQWCARDTYSMARAAQHDIWVNNDENPRLSLGIAEPLVSRVVTDRERFAHGSPALLDLQKRLAQVGLRGGTGIIVDLGQSHYFSLILHRSLDDPETADRNDAALLEALAPHLREACAIAMKLEAARHGHAMIASVVDQLRVGALICTPTGKVEWCNRSSEKMIERSTAITLSNGMLRCSRTTDQAILTQLLADARCSSSPTAASIGSAQAEAMQIIAMPPMSGPLARQDWSHQNDAISLVLLDQSHQPNFSIEATVALFGLTPAEARLAIALCQGASVADYARARGISVGTARVQLKQALAKTDSRRQGELIGKLYGSIIAQMH
jgi:DNA-binding CsgD family transcriptional regulator/PAS domain-containing protein